MLGELTGEEEAHGSLDLAGGEGGLLVVAGEAGCLEGKALEDVVDEGVEDGHAALGDTGVGVDLLEDLVDVRGVRLGSLHSLLAGDLLGGLCLSLLGEMEMERERERERKREGVIGARREAVAEGEFGC